MVIWPGFNFDPAIGVGEKAIGYERDLLLSMRWIMSMGWRCCYACHDFLFFRFIPLAILFDNTFVSLISYLFSLFLVFHEISYFYGSILSAPLVIFILCSHHFTLWTCSGSSKYSFSHCIHFRKLFGLGTNLSNGVSLVEPSHWLGYADTASTGGGWLVPSLCNGEDAFCLVFPKKIRFLCWI
ncbi:hypothetical protein QBC38DRAFT_255947 [Podospora fimiseda]|uniref:Uncharacterized protein n=1 Tax=Podospora fimiseda TaxID=252190 RepID=A0AAN7GZ97_9PEZI|nr:hypothetical protein QBC38DRAFT_255947 [Podospora fimiseda]